MKILSVSHVSDVYGSSRCLERIATRLAAGGHELIVVIPQRGPLQEVLERAGIRVLHHPWLPVIDRNLLSTSRDKLRLMLTFPLSIFWLAWIVVRFRIDLVHSNSATIFSPAFAARLTGRPHVWHMREFFLEFPDLWRRYERIIHRFSTVVIAMSTAVRDQFSAPFQSKVEVVYDGLPRAEFDTLGQAEAAETFKRSFGLTGRPLTAVVGRIKWVRKGQEVLVRAAALLRHKYPTAMYIIVGSPAPGYEEHLLRLHELVKELDLCGRVIFTGDIVDVRPVYAAMYVTVAPPIDPEPFGCIVVESMALGTPVIGSDAAGIAEQIVDGETGFLFRPGCERELADKLDRIFGDVAMRSEMSAKGVERFLGEFEMDRCYSEYLRVFESAIAHGGAPPSAHGGSRPRSDRAAAVSPGVRP
jgi:glycosyltransferase involved in cell wall biosynthesis